jgi:hypothetical protein
MTTATFPRIFASMALLPASTKPRTVGYVTSFPRVFDVSLRMMISWTVANSSATCLGCRGFRGLTGWAVTTDRLWTTTLGGAEAATLGAAICTMRLTDDAHHLRKGLPLGGVVAFPVAPTDWPVQTAIGAPSCPTFSVPHANGSATWPSTVTCLLPLSASSGT